MTTVPATRPPRAPAPLPMTPGRWLTLMIGVPIALALIAFTGFSVVSGIGQAHLPGHRHHPPGERSPGGQPGRR